MWTGDLLPWKLEQHKLINCLIFGHSILNMTYHVTTIWGYFKILITVGYIINALYIFFYILFNVVIIRKYTRKIFTNHYLIGLKKDTDKTVSPQTVHDTVMYLTFTVRAAITHGNAKHYTSLSLLILIKMFHLQEHDVCLNQLFVSPFKHLWDNTDIARETTSMYKLQHTNPSENETTYKSSWNCVD